MNRLHHNTANQDTDFLARMHQLADDLGAGAASVEIELQQLIERGRVAGRVRGAKDPATPQSVQTQFHQQRPSSSLSYSRRSASPSAPAASSTSMPQRLPNTAPQRGAKARTATTTTTTTNQTPHRASSPSADQIFRFASRSERPARSATFHTSSSFDSLSAASGAIMAAGAPSARKRSRTLDMYDGAVEDEAHSKGGHSLRKRARIDYTQEMIDDELGIPAAKSDPALKPNVTPTARGRKKRNALDGSDEESDDGSSNPKRRRTDRSPAPARGASSRRRHPSKKSTTDLPAFVDQPSDNDVQDTILVGVSMDGPPDAEESDQSSFRESESRPTSSDESDIAQARAQPLTPVVQPSQSVNDRVSLPPEVNEAIGNNSISEQPDDKSRVSTAPMTLTSPSEKQSEHASDETEKRRESSLAVPTIVAAAAAQVAEAEGESQQQEPAESSHPESIEQSTTDASELKTAQQHTNQLIPESQDPAVLTPQPLLSRTSSGRTSRTSRPTGPARLPQLDSIYNAPTPFASHLRLTPYEKEDVALPGPYTEWVYPAVQGSKEKLESTPIQTPTPTPSPIEPTGTIFKWDGRRRLKTGEFFKLHRLESKRRRDAGEPPISMIEFNNQLAKMYQSAQREAADSTKSQLSTKVVVNVVDENDSATRQNSPDIESQQPTAAPSPAPAGDEIAEEDAVDEEPDAEETVDSQVKPVSPAEPVEVSRNPAKQYLFPKIRDPSEFVDALEGYQDLDTHTLYDRIAAAVEALHTYQQEYNELRKILDDEDNAKRRQANDKTIVNWENRQKADEPLPFRRHFDDAVKGPIPYELRGVRAPKPYIDDPVLEHQREEDRIMAQAYGFKHNNHPTQVGRQNPEEQRWDMAENRLRKRTEKGAELAEENVVEGKRTRKPRYVSDQSKDPSRSATPTGGVTTALGRRQKRKPAISALLGDEVEDLEQGQAAETSSEPVRKGRAGRVRGSVLNGQEPAPVVGEADTNQTEDEEVENKPKAGRRRARGAAAVPEPPTSVPPGFGTEANKPKRLRGAKGPGNHDGTAEIASSSFYSNASATQPDSRPSTASSDGTAHTADTAESTYSLRDKRKRNFALENDPELEPRPQRRGRGSAAPKPDKAEPKKRGPRRKDAAAQPTAPTPTPTPASPQLQPIGAKFVNNFVSGPAVVEMGSGAQPVALPAPAPFLHTFNATPAFAPGAPPPPPPPPPVKKPITKIKVTNNGSSPSGSTSRADTPANGTAAAGASSTKAGGKGSRGSKSSASAEAKSGSNAAAMGNGDFDKPYAEMTKSEKMSWSMRRRWASGEMQGAVEKRRTTLANKKAEKAATNNQADPNTGTTTTTTTTATTTSNTTGAGAGSGGQTTDSGPGSAGPSHPNTPVPVSVAPAPGQPGPAGPLALPQRGPVLLQAPPPPPPPQPHHPRQPQPQVLFQQHQHQHPRPYAMPPGPHRHGHGHPM